MKDKLLFLLGTVILLGNVAYSQELLYEEPTKSEQVWENVSAKSQELAETTADNIKSGSKKTAKYVKEKSKSAVEKATPYVQSGAEKAKK